MADEPQAMDFGSLVEAIRQVHEQCAAQAGRAVNVSLTVRNWAIGHYIREYEQNGADRAQYGQRVLETLAQTLQATLDKCYTGRYLGLCRQFYETYPQIRKSLISRFGVLGNGKSAISELPAVSGIGEAPGAGTLSPQRVVAIEKLVERLSFTHIVELIKLDGQLNTYVSWYRKNVMADGDNLPVGLLLCTHKDHALVEYALAGMDNQLFVSKYQLELPRKEDIQSFLEEKLREVGDAR